MLEKQEEKIIALRKLLEKPASIGILIHTNPDGDAVGSGLGLYHYLTLKGHTVTVISPTQLPLNMRWLPAAGEIVIYERDKAKAREILNSADILFFLDHNDLKRLGDMAPEFVNLSATSIMVDHHPQPLMPVTLQFSDTSKSSTAEYVGSIIMQLSPDEPLNLQSAESLFTGIVTDTGGFSYNSSRPETFEIVTQIIIVDLRKCCYPVSRMMTDRYSFKNRKVDLSMLTELCYEHIFAFSLETQDVGIEHARDKIMWIYLIEQRQICRNIAT